MAKKPTEFEPFSDIVCERLRRLRKKRARYAGQREKMFKSRDAADAGLNETGTDETKKRERLLSEYGESVRKIKDLDHKLRDTEKQLDQTIEYADEPELFPDPDTFNPPEEDEEKGEEGDDGEPEGKKGSPAPASAGVGE